MPEEFDRTIENIAVCKEVAEKLLKERERLIGKDIELDRRYPHMAAKYRGRITDIQERNDQVFINIELKPGKVQAFLVASADDKFAQNLIRHAEKTRIRIKF
ncbi:MAG: hypothetical protein ACE5J7_00090 [Candidatus Aenigmatarchaeota archaeon]